MNMIGSSLTQTEWAFDRRKIGSQTLQAIQHLSTNGTYPTISLCCPPIQCEVSSPLENITSSSFSPNETDPS